MIDTMTKKCTTCELTKPSTEFYSSKGRTSSKCTACKRAYQVEYSKRRKSDPKKYEEHLQYHRNYGATHGIQHRRNSFEWLDEAKAKPCMDCGGTFPPECMDFDHRDPATKLFNVSGGAVTGRSLESVQAEVAKCDLVCANCHRIRTAKQQGFRKYKKHNK